MIWNMFHMSKCLV